jgi:capsular polysaccharide biosynthesis protein
MDLIEVINVFWRSKWIIITVTVIVTIIVAYQSFNSSDSYEAKSILAVGNFTPSAGGLGGDDLIAASYAKLVNTPQVQEKAFGQGGTATAGVDVVADIEEDTPYILLTGNGDSPQATQDTVNQVATALVARVSELQAEINDNARVLTLDELTTTENELAAEQAKPDADSGRVSALQSYRQALIQQGEDLALQVSRGPNLTIVSSAVESTKKAATPWRDTILGFVVGLAGGIVVGFIYDAIRKALAGSKGARTGFIVKKDSPTGLEPSE